MARPARQILSFDLEPGQRIGNKYIVEEFLGGGYQGEVYKVVEARTKVRRAAKLFYPRRNEGDRAARGYARKLDRLRRCPLVIQYHHVETMSVNGTKVTCLFSDYVDGVLLWDYVNAQPGKRIEGFEALHIAYHLVCGLEQIHSAREYHGDLHPQNILIRPSGILFDVKIVDFYDHGRSSRSRWQDDIVDVANILYWMVGGRRRYSHQPPLIKSICLGRRRDRIIAHFPTASRLRKHLEQFNSLEFA